MIFIPLGQGNPYIPQKKCVDPLSAVAVGGSILGGLSSLWSSSEQSANQKELARLQHEYNKKEMAYSQQLNKEYQSFLNNTMYGAQVSGMKGAGLNPAGANTNVGAMQGSNGLHTGSSAPTAPIPDIAGGIAAGANAGAAIAQTKATLDQTKANVDLTKAQAAKTRSETKGQENQNQAFWDRFSNEMDNLKAIADELRSRSGLNTKKQAEVDKNIELMDESKTKIQAEVDNIKQSTDESKARMNFTNKQAAGYDRFLMAQIKQMLAHAGLLNGQNAREGQMLLFNMGNAAAMADYYDNNSRIFRIQAQWNEFLMNQDKRWNEFNQWLNAGTQVLDCLGRNFNAVATGISSFVPFTSHTSSFGYTPFGKFQTETYNSRGPFRSGYGF